MRNRCQLRPGRSAASGKMGTDDRLQSSFRPKRVQQFDAKRLTQRLTLLEQTGILVKTIHSTMPPRTSYELTEAGLALRPVLESIVAWSGNYLSHLKEPPECPGLDCSGPLS